jgi:hypothetical protein
MGFFIGIPAKIRKDQRIKGSCKDPQRSKDRAKDPQRSKDQGIVQRSAKIKGSRKDQRIMQRSRDQGSCKDHGIPGITQRSTDQTIATKDQNRNPVP